ncbi:T9SS type A sorting domain-containing protein [Carboxylicivirga marina]|uniref:T9SS type A sorting domain-containing protein n=1 Tax=Carboxylicivirga marina TaxID=2800988 RepID=A0ABS1HQK2_9BACT|nr:T9SS type A sorting domain-containing protein [Carboxylicivirga marina]MBK3519942.1 T9SS type A sorting domain-containing protein [Carboxylicivirga marina]
MKNLFTTTFLLVLALSVNAQIAYVGNPSFEELDVTTNTGAKGWTLVLSNGAQATASVVTTDASDGTNAIEVIITNKGTSYGEDPLVPKFNDNVKLVSEDFDFSTANEVPAAGINASGEFNVRGTCDVKHTFSSAISISWRQVVSINGTEQPKSNNKAIASGSWLPMATDKNGAPSLMKKSFTYASTGMTIRAEIQMGENVGTIYFDNVKSEVTDGQAKVSTSIEQDDIKDLDIKVWSNNRAINISNQAGQAGMATVYDLGGRQVKQVQISAEMNTINIPHGGLYIVKSEIGNEVYTNKVVVK